MKKLPIKLSLILRITVALLVVVFSVGLMVDTSSVYADDDSAPADSGATDSGSVTTGAAILTDKPDYTPDQTPVISGAGFDPNSVVTITITAPDGTATTFTTTTDSQGQFTATYEGPLTKGEFTVDATDGVSTATTTFLDATAILYPTDDSWVDWRNPDQNYGSSPELHVMFWGPEGNNRRAYLMFDLAALPDTAIDLATLYLYRYRASVDVDDDPDIPAVYKTDDSWTESTITWNNQPGPGAFVADGSPSFGFGWISWNITGYVQDEYAGDKTLSVLLMFSPGWKHADFYSTEYSGITYDPYLAITYPTPAPLGGSVERVLVINWFGIVRAYLVNEAGVLLQNVYITSPDGNATLVIPAGTLVLDTNGLPLYLHPNPDIIAGMAGTPPAPPGTTIAAVYECLPSGVTFKWKDAQLIVRYNPATVAPGGVVVIAYYDEASGSWVELETAGYVVGGEEVPNTVISSFSHFTYFALLIKSPAE